MADEPATALLDRFRAETASSEIVHNLVIWTANATTADQCGPACTGWSDGNCQGMPRTNAFRRPQLDNVRMLVPRQHAR